MGLYDSCKFTSTPNVSLKAPLKL